MFIASCVLLSSVAFGWAGTTIDPANRYAYGANFGWLDWAADTNDGAVIGAYICSGYIYSPNVGWISLGGGSPTNGIQYQNLSADDFGVNQDGLGNLRGFAYGANIGWINFEDTGLPKIDMVTGKMSGCVWSANCGWISLSNAAAYLQTDTISPGQLDTNSLPIAWELTYFGTTNVDPNADPDHDGVPNYQEYLSGTNPTKASDRLVITSESIAPGGTSVALTWNTVATRFYYVRKTPSLGSPAWADSGLGLIAPAGSSTSRGFADTSAPTRYYRIQAVRPLTP